MRHVVLTTLAATLVAFAGCSSSDEGSGGGSGTGGTAGTGGGGSEGALSFDETSAYPATAGSAAAIDAATRIAGAVSAIFELADAGGDAAVGGPSPKVLVPGFCASGEADLVLPPGPVTSWQGGQIVLTLTDCEGSVLSSGSVSGPIRIDIETVTLEFSTLRLDTLVDVGLMGDARIEGTFAAVAFAAAGRLSLLQLGKQLDTDDMTISDANMNLALGCFGINVTLAENVVVAPLAVARLGNQTYTVNDYAQSPPGVALDEDGIASNGTLTMHSGDNSAASPERTGPCPGFGDVGDGSMTTATFFEGGCIELAGIDASSQAFTGFTTWEQLLDFDFTPSQGSCGVGAMPPNAQCPSGGDVVVSADAYIRGGTNLSTNYGAAPNLLLKGDPDGEYSRKTYLSFDLSAVTSVSAATLVVTLQRHVSTEPQPGDLSGIIDPAQDWMLGNIAENQLAWENAPVNDPDSGVGFLDQGAGPGSAVRRLVVRYDFDIDETPTVRPDLENTQYAFDVTEFVQWAVGANPSFSDWADEDADRQVTLLLALSREGKADGLALFSKEAPMPEGWACSAAPFLDIEP